jgi:hypothetical protein
VVVLVELTLFASYHAERWRDAILPRHDPRLAGGEGLVIRSDGHGYYAWLRSLLVDGDWSFDNEFDDHNPLGDWVPAARTRRGLRANHWSVGPACLWSATIVPAHAILMAVAGHGGRWRPDGYTLPYQLLVGLTTVLASVLGLGLLYGICRRYARPSRASLAAALLTLGTPIVYYSTIEVTMAHGPATVFLAGLVWYWLKTYGSDVPRRWLLVGLLLGATALMRWQLVTFALLPAGEWLLHSTRGRRRSIWLLAVAALGAGLAFLPQAVAWKTVYGSWVVAPLATSSNWLRPSWWQVLGSVDRGLFYWTPLTLLALAGFLAFFWRRPGQAMNDLDAGEGEPLELLLAAFMLQAYLVASLLGGEMGLGVSFGQRFLTEAVVALAPGLALLLERAPRRCFHLLSGLCCLLALWNLLLMAEHRYGLIPAAGGVEPGILVTNAVRLVVRKKLLLAGPAFAGPLLLWLFSRRALRTKLRVVTPARCGET